MLYLVQTSIIFSMQELILCVTFREGVLRNIKE